MESAVWAASSDSEDATTEIDEEEGVPSNTGWRCKQKCVYQIEKMESAVWAASSDSEDATTEIDEEEGVSSNTGQHGSLFEVAAESTSDAQGSIGFAFMNKAAPPRKSWESLDVLKAEAGEKPNHKDIQNLIHFGEKDGNKVSVPGGVHSILTVNISEEDGLSYSDSEDLTIPMISEDEEQELVAEEDLGETTEEVEFHSSTSEIGVCQKQNPRRSEVQRKRNLARGQDQASKVVKRSEQPQKVQMPHARTGCGESASDPTPCQQSESFQARHLEGNRAAKEPINCAQSTESLSPSSQMAEIQKVTECPECRKKFKTSWRLHRHRIYVHHIETKYKCSECNMCFANEVAMSTHRCVPHNVEKPFRCLKCNTMFDSILLLSGHYAETHDVCRLITCLDCCRVFSDPSALQKHRNAIHEKQPFTCTECSLQFRSLQLFKHHISTHQTTFKCPGYNMYVAREHTMNKLFNSTESTETFSFTNYMKGFAADKALDFPWEVRK